MAALLEAGQKKLQQINTILNANIVLLERELKQEKKEAERLIETLKDKANSLKANIRIHKEFFNYASLVLRNRPYPGVENYTRYAVARLGLLPLANIEPLEPEFGPVINNVTSFHYCITVPKCRNVNANRSVFIAIVSAPENSDKRKVVRQTWAKHLQVENEKGLLEIAGFAFILGLTENNVTQNSIKEESATFGDIIQIEMSDSYRNLSLKVAGLFNWLHKNCAAVDFVVKVDDDVYVNARNLAYFAQSYHRSNRSMFGLSAGYLIANRVGKWNISYEEWPWKQYPPYYLGPAVIIPGSTIRPLLAAFQTTPMMPFDDVYYGGICTEKAGIKIQQSSNSFNVFATSQPDFPHACDIRLFVAWLTASSKHMNTSHMVTDDFYHKRTQCIVSDASGTNSAIDSNQPVPFVFV
ncbi:UDP-GalNAc:beta-1,3-N-acetylgalactosaminyltransferase 1-like [Daphnia carinata]|uniref:UDP-GalNAc:beta-1, 3-N-acetylgalactosaminyltransferase 1-like n=1 Tax=Daphnia carinata TaxID=120202 RepID=UPI002580A83E|nr:UDP-GalNAc:beta-1,3-N-acetylgalactosaminyltransferase 1-like [Daphnia carinata]